MPRLWVPKSAVQTVTWPALPVRSEAMVLSLLWQLETSQWWPAEALLGMQLRQLEQLLAFSARTVPLYRERLKVLRGLKAGQLTLERFREIPVLTRSDIQEAGTALYTTSLPANHGKAFDIKTSGSTGRPITVRGSMITGLMLRGNNLRYHRWFDRDFMGKTACIRMQRGNNAKAADSGKPIPWVDGFPSGPMYMHHVQAPVSEQWDWLKKIDPDYLLTFPSNLLGLIRYSRKLGEKLPKLRHVAALGEALDPNVRTICERDWGVPVIDAYSSQEFGLIAVQCPSGTHYHAQSETNLVEILDDDGKPCKPGETGRLVLTALHNFASPLIRYQIGDLAEVGEPCACGRGLPVVNRILGRARNMLTLPSGDQLCPRFVFEDFAWDLPIRQLQVVQNNLETLTVRLVSERKLTGEEEKRVRDSLVKTARHPFAIQFEYVPEIPRAASGKFEEFLSQVA